MNKRTRISVYVLWAAIGWSAAAAQTSPLLSPVPEEEEDPVAVSAAWSVDRIHPTGAAVLALILDIRAGYHVMADQSQLGEFLDFKPIATRVWVHAAQDGVLSEPPSYPKARPFKAEFIDGEIMSFEGRTAVFLPVRSNRTESRGALSLTIGIDYQACAPAYCLMPQRRMIEAALPVAPAGEAVTAIQPELFREFEARAADRGRDLIRFRLFGFSFTLDLSARLAAAFIPLLAALGGFLLNFTPCVLPLIPIKIISMSHAAGDRRRCFILGLSTFAGVLAFWIVLGGIVSLASGFTSTNQLFQYPAFTLGVGLVIATMAIGMFGVYAMRLPAFVYALNPRQETLGGALGVGVLTAVLSTPCTAPFMGTAAAWAATQTAAVTLAVFGGIGGGMGLPYAVLAAFPRLIRRIPKTGPANELLKQAMGMFMLAAAAYFIGIGLGTLLSDPAAHAGRLHWWPVMILIAAAGAWTGIRALRLAASRAGKAFWAAVGMSVAALSLYAATRLTDTGPIAWAAYTPERLAGALAERKAVVMIFTAEWCLNCKALEQGVWSDPELGRLMSQPAVAAVKVDLTGNNPEGRKMLQAAGSLTIPLVTVLRPDGEAVFRSDFYTAGQVADAIRTAMAAPQRDP